MKKQTKIIIGLVGAAIVAAYFLLRKKPAPVITDKAAIPIPTDKNALFSALANSYQQGGARILTMPEIIQNEYARKCKVSEYGLPHDPSYYYNYNYGYGDTGISGSYAPAKLAAPNELPMFLNMGAAEYSCQEINNRLGKAIAEEQKANAEMQTYRNALWEKIKALGLEDEYNIYKNNLPNRP